MMSGYVFLVFTILFTVASQLLQKQLAVGQKTQFGELLATPLFWYSLVLLGLSMLFWIMVLSRLELSRAYPMLSINYVLLLYLSRVLYAEKIPLSRVAGVLLIVIGVAIMGIS